MVLLALPLPAPGPAAGCQNSYRHALSVQEESGFLYQTVTEYLATASFELLTITKFKSSMYKYACFTIKRLPYTGSSFSGLTTTASKFYLDYFIQLINIHIGVHMGTNE